jgi:hypothetical protein
VLKPSSNPHSLPGDSFDEDTFIEEYDAEDCLILRGAKRVGFNTAATTTRRATTPVDEDLRDSPLRTESSTYLAKICNGLGRHGCEQGCINCSFKFQCAQCKEGWDHCRCHDRSDTVSKKPSETASTNDVQVHKRLRALEHDFQSRLSSVQDELTRERELRKELETKLSGGRETSPDVT